MLWLSPSAGAAAADAAARARAAAAAAAGAAAAAAAARGGEAAAAALGILARGHGAFRGGWRGLGARKEGSSSVLGGPWGAADGSGRWIGAGRGSCSSVSASAPPAAPPRTFARVQVARARPSRAPNL